MDWFSKGRRLYYADGITHGAVCSIQRAVTADCLPLQMEQALGHVARCLPCIPPRPSARGGTANHSHLEGFHVKKIKFSEFCYHCGLPKFNRDHVPPLSFFPSGDDPDLRKNLFTVPACEEHNSGKSLDDDYVRMVMAGMSTNINSDSRLIHLREHTVSALANNGALLALVLKDARCEQAGSSQRTTGEIDPERILGFLTAVARGVLCHERKIWWDGDVNTIAHFLVGDESPTFLKEASRVMLETEPEFGSKGENELVFYYKLSDLQDQKSEAFVVDMCFYGEFRVTSAFLNGRSQPTKLQLQD